MRKLLSLGIAFLFAGVLGACEQQPTTPDAAASQHDPGGVVARADIDAVPTQAAEENGFSEGDDVGQLRIADDKNANKLTVTGDANGLNPDRPYFSLFYDVESFAEGFGACEPETDPPFEDEHDTDEVLSLSQMEIGAWNVTRNGTATLQAENIGFTESDGTFAYAPVEVLGTVSIRDLTVEGPFGPGTGPDAVVGCGSIHPVN